MAKTVANTLFSDWSNLLTEFKNKLDGTLAQVNEVKEKVEGMKVDILNEIANGQYIRDPQRIVLSAPEVIIGDVDKSGNLLSQAGTVIVNGSALKFNGAGLGGKIEMRAPFIDQKAVDPGIDGKQAIVYEGSQISSQARSIIIDSKSPEHDVDKMGTFLPISGGANGIFINAETNIEIGATKSNVKKYEVIDQLKTRKTDRKTELTNSLNALEATIAGSVDKLNALLAKEKELNGDDADLTKTNILALDELVTSLRGEIPTFYGAMSEYADKLSELAEINRQISCLDKEKSKQQPADTFKTNSTDTSIKLVSENVKIHSADGEGNIRVNAGADIDIKGNDIKVRSLDVDDKLTEEKDKGTVTIQGRTVNVSTADLADPTYENNKLAKGSFPLKGTVNIQSKVINMDAVDIQKDGDKQFKETALTADSEVNIRAMKVKVKTINTEGKSVGKFSVNSQSISMKSTDISEYKPDLQVDDNGIIKRPSKFTSEKIAANSQMLLLTDNIYLGYKKKEKEFISTNINVVANSSLKLISKEKAYLTVVDEVGGTTKSLVQLDANKAVMLTEGTAKLGGDSTKITGKTTFDSPIEGKDIKAKNVECDNIKSKNLADGVIVAGQAQKPDVPKTDNIEEVKGL